MKHIALIAHLSEVSGAGVALVDTAVDLQKEFRVSLILPGDGPLGNRARANGLDPVIICNTEVDMGGAGIGRKLSILRHRARYVTQLKRFLKINEIDLAYINSSASVFAGLAARGARVPIAWHIHETLNGQNKATRIKGAIIKRWSDGLIYASQSGMDSLPHPYDKPAIIARNAIAFHELEKLRVHRLAMKSTHPNPKPIIGMNGTIPRKGADVLLNAVALLGECEGTASLPRVIIAGPPPSDPDFAAVLNDISQTTTLNGTVEFSGLQNSLLPLYADCDIFVSASRNEALPIAIVEAMAAGVPVISTSVGDCAELLNHGERGWLVPPDDPHALAHAITQALTSPDIARQKAELAFQYVNSQYGQMDFRQPLVSFINNIIKTGRRASR